MVQYRRTDSLIGLARRLALGTFLCLGILLISACAGDSGEQAQQTKTQDFEVKVGKSLYLSSNTPGGQSLQSNSVLSIIVEWTIIKPVIDPNVPPPAVIINPNSTTPTFVAYVAGEYVLRMTITWEETNELLAEREITINVSLDDIQKQKPANHIASTDMCTDCHDAVSWLISSVDHTQVIGTCSSCHDGIAAQGKGPLHVDTNTECDACHVTQSWFLPSNIPSNHVDFMGNCITCHDGVTARGKSSTHLNTTDTCETCHNLFYWTPVSIIDHNHVLGSCASCHDGVLARGKSPSHVATEEACDACHSTTGWLNIAGGCTNINPCPTPTDPGAGGNAGAGTGGSSGGGNGSGTPGGSGGTSGTVPDHTTLLGTCVSCHNGQDATGKSSLHIVTTDMCDACHQPAPVPWKPLLKIDHTQGIGTCSSCHDGVIASGKAINHVPTQLDCDSCHVVDYWVVSPPQPVI